MEEDSIDVKVENQSHELNISYIDKVHGEMFSKFHILDRWISQYIVVPRAMKKCKESKR